MIPLASLCLGSRFRCVSGRDWTLTAHDRYLIRARRDDGVEDVFAITACAIPLA